MSMLAGFVGGKVAAAPAPAEAPAVACDEQPEIEVEIVEQKPTEE
jgi:hypothetical protein